MKTFALFIFFIFSINSNNSYKIIGNFKYCDSNKTEYGERMLAISLNGVVLNDKIKTGSKGYFEILDLIPGTYVIGYDNIFNQRVRKTIEVNSNIYSIDLCLDEFQDTNTSTLFNTMKDGDKLVLNISSNGCFHTFEEEFTFIFKDKKYFVNFTNKQNKNITLPLDISKINYLIKFEKIIRCINKIDGRCTTNEEYILSKNGVVNFRASDNSCQWGGVNQISSYIHSLK